MDRGLIDLPPRRRSASARPRALIIGAGDIGSAIAVTLFRAGYAVVMCERERPSHSRRGMAFTDAWYRGEATLHGVVARSFDSLANAYAALHRSENVIASSADFIQWISRLDVDILVDARMRKRERGQCLMQLAPLTIGTGPGFVAGEHVHAVIETEWGDALGTPILKGGAAPFRGEPRRLQGYARERYVYTPRAGKFCTSLAIGDRVAAGQPVGRISDWVCHAPLDGVLRGLSANGALVRKGEKIVEVDPRGDPAACFGIAERPSRIAAGVANVLAMHHAERKREAVVANSFAFACNLRGAGSKDQRTLR